MKKLICCFGMVLSTFYVNAQHAKSGKIAIGPKAGLNIADAWGSDASLAESKFGMHAGLVLNSNISWRHAFQMEILYSNNGFRNITKRSGITTETSVNLNYIDVPLLYQFNLTPKRRATYKTNAFTKTWYVSVGPQFSALISSNRKTETSKPNDDSFKGQSSEMNLSTLTNPYQVGLVAGLGFNATNNIVISARYGAGLTPIGKKGTTYESNIKNNVIQASLSYLLPIKTQ